MHDKVSQLLHFKTFLKLQNYDSNYYFIAIIKDDIKVDKTHIFDPSDPTRPHSNISDPAAVEGLKLVYMH